MNEIAIKRQPDLILRKGIKVCSGRKNKKSNIITQRENNRNTEPSFMQPPSTKKVLSLRSGVSRNALIRVHGLEWIDNKSFEDWQYNNKKNSAPMQICR